MATPVPPTGGARVTVRPCPVCAAPVATDALFCPACGTTFGRRRGPDTALIAAGVLAVVVGILVALLLTQGDSGSGRTTSAATGTTTAATTTTSPATTTAPATPPVATATAPATTVPAITTPPAVTTPPAATAPTTATTPPAITATPPGATTTAPQTTP